MLTMNPSTTTAMHQPQQNQVQQQAQPGPQQFQQQQQFAPSMPTGPQAPAIFASNSFGSASSPPSNVNLQLQQAAPLSSSSFHIPSPRQGADKRSRNGRLSVSSTHSAPPMMPAPPPTPVGADDEDDEAPNQSSSKKRRSANYVAPRIVPTTFTSVTAHQPGPAGGLRRNMSFSRIDPYVSYAQTPSLVAQQNNSTTSSAGNNNAGSSSMDMDASGGNHSTAGDRVRSMSF